jgi:uncharacterized glyoxalase superfamily protein PhnB
MSRIIDSRCVLAVRNLQRSTDYWVKMLGFDREPIDAPGWSFLRRGPFKVMLGECPDDRDAGELQNHSWFVYLYVDGIDAFYAELAGRGAELTSRPADKPWGLREFALRTPDGHRITCGEPIASGSRVS